jgi:hypothetical protein
MRKILSDSSTNSVFFHSPNPNRRSFHFVSPVEAQSMQASSLKATVPEQDSLAPLKKSESAAVFKRVCQFDKGRWSVDAHRPQRVTLSISQLLENGYTLQVDKTRPLGKGSNGVVYRGSLIKLTNGGNSMENASVVAVAVKMPIDPQEGVFYGDIYPNLKRSQRFFVDGAVHNFSFDPDLEESPVLIMPRAFPLTNILPKLLDSLCINNELCNPGKAQVSEEDGRMRGRHHLFFKNIGNRGTITGKGESIGPRFAALVVVSSLMYDALRSAMALKEQGVFPSDFTVNNVLLDNTRAVSADLAQQRPFGALSDGVTAFGTLAFTSPQQVLPNQKLDDRPLLWLLGHLGMSMILGGEPLSTTQLGDLGSAFLAIYKLGVAAKAPSQPENQKRLDPLTDDELQAFLTRMFVSQPPDSDHISSTSPAGSYTMVLARLFQSFICFPFDVSQASEKTFEGLDGNQWEYPATLDDALCLMKMFLAKIQDTLSGLSECGGIQVSYQDLEGITTDLNLKTPAECVRYFLLESNQITLDEFNAD